MQRNLLVRPDQLISLPQLANDLFRCVSLPLHLESLSAQFLTTWLSFNLRENVEIRPFEEISETSTNQLLGVRERVTIWPNPLVREW